MGIQRQENLEPGELPRAQRLTDDEARAVIALWQRHQSNVVSSQPAVSDVAEGLSIPITEAQELLRQVRARPTAPSTPALSAQDQLKLEEVFLAEEERRLSELRRQGAELRRQQAEEERQWAEERRRGRPHQKPLRPQESKDPVPGWAISLLLMLCAIIYYCLTVPIVR